MAPAGAAVSLKGWSFRTSGRASESAGSGSTWQATLPPDAGARGLARRHGGDEGGDDGGARAHHFQSRDVEREVDACAGDEGGATRGSTLGVRGLLNRRSAGTQRSTAGADRSRSAGTGGRARKTGMHAPMYRSGRSGEPLQLWPSKEQDCGVKPMRQASPSRRYMGSWDMGTCAASPASGSGRGRRSLFASRTSQHQVFRRSQQPPLNTAPARGLRQCARTPRRYALTGSSRKVNTACHVLPYVLTTKRSSCFPLRAR